MKSPVLARRSLGMMSPQLPIFSATITETIGNKILVKLKILFTEISVFLTLMKMKKKAKLFDK